VTALAAIGCLHSQDLTPRPKFEVASIRRNTSGDRRVAIGGPSPGRFRAENVWLRFLIEFAWRVEDFQVTGGPGWAASERYDIEATVDGDATIEQKRVMMQTLLEDRFQLMLHRETKESPVYVLMAARGGTKLQPSIEGSCVPRNSNMQRLAAGRNFCGDLSMSPRSVEGTAISIQQLTAVLSQTLQRTVIDKTGLTATFDVHVEWTADQSTPGLTAPGLAPPGPAPSDDPPGRSIFTAIQEQLGLKLEPAKAPVEVLVIDRLERPSEN
jgi:uncharacterized protein (TIGR03435 family)